MKTQSLHRWNLTPRQAVRLQIRLAQYVRQTPPSKTIRRVAGLDAAFHNRQCLAAVVLWDLRLRQIHEQHTAARPLRFPYIPGLLSFRELPALLAALRKLRHAPDLILCDGQGLAHPRRFGIACHLGLLTGLPTIGCAKSRLLGNHRDPARRRGSRRLLRDGTERIGTVLRTQEGVKPLYISVGHLIDLATAERVVLRCATAHRLPEPTRLADQLVGAAKRAFDSSI